MCHFDCSWFHIKMTISSYEQYYQFNLLLIPVLLEAGYPYTHIHTQLVAPTRWYVKRKQAEVFSNKVEYVGKKYVVEYVNDLITK